MSAARVSLELATFMREHFDGDDGWFSTVARRYAYNLPTEARRFGSHADVRAALAAAGSHFYDRAAVRAFGARTSDPHMAAGSFWVESVKQPDYYNERTGEHATYAREYRVSWVASHDGEHLDVEHLAPVATLAEARRQRSELARLVRAYRAEAAA